MASLMVLQRPSSWSRVLLACREMRRRAEKVKIKEKPKEYKADKNLEADVWCQPKIVVEIEADNVTRSPIHAAKFALRFPRLVRFRDDKSTSQVSTVREVKKLYQLQGVK